MASRIPLGAAALALLLVSASGVSGASAKVGPTPAGGSVFAFGWMTVRNPSTPANVPQIPAPNDTGQSQTFFGTGTYKHLNSIGRYKVTYPGLVPELGAGDPVALVTPMGSSRGMCNVANLADIGADFVVRIDCYNSAGAPQDTRFSTNLVMLTGASSGPAAAYLLADVSNPGGTGSYTPLDQYNSTGSGFGPYNRVHHAGTGNYTVHLPGLGGFNGGNFQVSVFGTLAGYCRVVTWGVGTPSSVKDAHVVCRNAAGALADRRFTLLYTKNMGLDLNLGANHTAYVWANLPTTITTYSPGVAVNWRSWTGTTTIKRLGIGWYRVRLNGIAATRGAAQVTPVGSGSTACLIGGIASTGTPQSVDVRCYKPSGAPSDSQFMVSYINA